MSSMLGGMLGLNTEPGDGGGKNKKDEIKELPTPPTFEYFQEHMFSLIKP